LNVSVDLDLFSDENLETDLIITALKKEFGNDFVFEGGNLKRAIFCYINNIKTDIVHYPHKQIGRTETEDGIRLYPDDDTAAMNRT